MTTNFLYLCINLPDCKIRRDSMREQAENASIPLEFFPATDGREGRPDLGDLKLKKGKWDWRGFEIPDRPLGAFLSHRRALEQFLSKSELSFCVVFEDDAQFESDLAKRILELTQVKGWDMIKLESRNRSRRGYPVKEMSWGGELISGTKSDIGATALLWTRKGAEKFLKSSETIQYPVDIHFTHYAAWNLDMLDIFPPIVTQKDYPSNIGDLEPLPEKPAYRQKSLHRTIGQSAWSIFRLVRALRVWAFCKMKN